MACSDTLLFKHLPTDFHEKEKEEFLKYFGASEVKCISSKINKYNIAFAKFESAAVAENVLHRLHQVNILGNLLSVEFAKLKSLDSSLPRQNLISSEKKENMENEMYYKQFIDKLSSWHTEVNFKQPIPCHLKYQYPPPDMQTLINIVKVLVTVPKFYTQVLHLMNKMNLPCPYGKDILPEVELEVYPPDAEIDQMKFKKDLLIESNNIATSESEISSEEEIKMPKEIIPEKNKITKKRKIKIAKFFKPAPMTSQKVKKTTYDEVFEKPCEEKEPKKLKLGQNISLSESLLVPLQKSDQEFEVRESGFGFIHPMKKVNENEKVKETRDEREEERLEKKEEIGCISDKELFENRISEKDRAILPVYKNYAEGAPTCRLYIKNLSKTVVQNDLKFIYNRYLASNLLDNPNMFDIRLMQEGRMKGQAFVTLQTVELAQKALRETNGYILKDKPLVVQFARSAAK